MLPNDLELIVLVAVMLGLLLLNCQDNGLTPLAELSKFPSVIPQVILLRLRDPSLDQDVIWILVNVSLSLI